MSWTLGAAARMWTVARRKSSVVRLAHKERVNIVTVGGKDGRSLVDRRKV
jgi:hypothetical protein